MAVASYFSGFAYGTAPQGTDLSANTTLAFATAGAVISAATKTAFPHLDGVNTRSLLQGVDANAASRTITITAPAADNTNPDSVLVLVRTDTVKTNTVTVTLSAGSFDYEDPSLTDDASFTIPVGGWAIIKRVNGSASPQVAWGSGLTGLPS